MSDTVEPPTAPPLSTSPLEEAARSSKKHTIITASVLAAILCIAVAGWVADNMPADNDYTGLTPRQAVSKWVANGGHDHGVAVDNAIGELKNLRPNASMVLVRAACVDIYQAAQDAFEYGPIPDGEAQAYWSTALAHLEAYANWCINGIDDGATSGNNDPAIANYNQQLARFTVRMREILLPAPSTAYVHRGSIVTSGKVMAGMALVVPNSAVILQGGNYWINVPGPNGQPTRKQFTPGAVGDNNTQVIGGLSEGEEILLPQPN